jgi:hypothetical protein
MPVAFTEKIMASGEHCHGAPMTHRDQSRAVRVREGRTEITTGPLTDVDEYPGGYLVVDCAGPERAAAIAAQIPDARFGVIEVRALTGMGGLES